MKDHADTPRSIDRSAFFAGAVMIAIGVFVIWDASTMQLGTPSRMGPGFYPMMIGASCLLFGLLICLLEFKIDIEPDETLTERGWPVWRGRVFVPLSMVVFAMLLRPAGLVPACVGLVCVASLAAPRLSFRRTLSLAVVTPFLVWFIFVFGLSLPFTVIKGVL